MSIMATLIKNFKPVSYRDIITKTMNLLTRRYQPMLSISCSLPLICIILFVSCQDKKIIENKNDKGQVIERHQIVKSKEGDKKHGVYERFDEQGKLIEQSNYTMGKLNGIRKLYNQGILESEESRSDDQYHGPYKEYHSNGNLRMEAVYVHDVMAGDVKVYYPSGKLKEIVRFVDNVENGPFIEYYENGKLKAEGQYKQLDGAVEDGELKLYDTTGILIRIMNCELGKCSTKWAKDTTLLR